MILNELYDMVNKDLEIDKTELDTESKWIALLNLMKK